MAIKITGFYQLPHQTMPELVDFNEVFDTSFMRKYTRFRTFEKFLQGSRFKIENQRDFEALPEEVAVLRKSSSHIMQLQQTIKPPVTKKAMSRAEREKTIVDMYNNGYSIDDIWEVSGFNSKSSIWRVLNKYGVYLNRGRTSGPRVKKQQDETK